MSDPNRRREGGMALCFAFWDGALIGPYTFHRRSLFLARTPTLDHETRALGEGGSLGMAEGMGRRDGRRGRFVEMLFLFFILLLDRFWRGRKSWHWDDEKRYLVRKDFFESYINKKHAVKNTYEVSMGVSVITWLDVVMITSGRIKFIYGMVYIHIVTAALNYTGCHPLLPRATSSTT